MRNEQELNKDILEITLKINRIFPELSKYIEEMPLTIPDLKNPEINSKILTEYYNSLDTLLKKYATNHTSTK
jgi:hypothetical protein